MADPLRRRSLDINSTDFHDLLASYVIDRLDIAGRGLQARYRSGFQPRNAASGRNAGDRIETGWIQSLKTSLASVVAMKSGWWLAGVPQSASQL